MYGEDQNLQEITQQLLHNEVEAQDGKNMEGNASKAANKLDPTVPFKRVQGKSSSTGSGIN